MTTYHSRENREDYSPVFTGNGDLAAYIDGEGNADAIWWAGRRYGDEHCRPLVPFGCFRLELGRAADAWSETLDPLAGTVTTEAVYGEITVVTETFVHADMNLIAVRKIFSGLPDDGLPARFRYRLSPKRFTSVPLIRPDRVELDYELDGQYFYRGKITLFSDSDADPYADSDGYGLRTVIRNGSCSFYLSFADDLFGDDPAVKSRAVCDEAARGFDALLASHKASWRSFHDEGNISVPDPELEEIYRTAAYHLRCATTHWSVPVNISPKHWHCRYFAFDEYFSFRGLITSGHASLARRVPEFRYRGLEHAIDRYSAGNVSGASYPWETLEDGTEGAPYGFWTQHVFHMAHIARGAWEYFLYTGDTGFLREKAYPMIAACAGFYRSQMVYRNYDGKTIVGRCTDLERLGSSIENAFMTTCAVITTFETLTAAAKLLGCEDAVTADCAAMAEELRRDLPSDGDRYVPYPGCTQKSIAVFSGTFPYYVLDPNDRRQRKATGDFCRNERGFGNMYPTGQRVSSWYALWKAITYARWQEPVRAAEAVEQAKATVGCFHEMFEINEPGLRERPWFSTSSGIFLNCVNEMLLQSEHGRLLIAPGVPESWQSFSFTLPAVGGASVRCAVENGVLTEFSVTGECALEPVFPDWIRRPSASSF